MRFLGWSTGRDYEVRRLLRHLPESRFVQGANVGEMACSLSTGAYDYLLTNHDSITALPAVAASMSTGTPLIIQIGGDTWTTNRRLRTIHRRRGNHRDVFKFRALSMVRDRVLPTANHYITLSPFLTRCVISELGIGRENITELPTPIRPQESADPHKNGKQLLTITNLNFPGKYYALLDALPRIIEVLENHPEARYHIAGNGLFLDDLRSAIDSSFGSLATDRICALGYVDDVDKRLSDTSVMVYPSYSDGYPTTILEAQTHGVPVVTVDTQGMRSQIEDEVSGRLISDPSSNAFGDAIDELLTDPERRHSLGQSGRDRIIKENDPETLAQRFKTTVSSKIGA